MNTPPMWTGWIPTLQYVRKLREAGKTSVVRAMRSESGRTETIALDDRTIAIDVLRNWEVEEGDGLVFEVWDLGGQPQYHTSHSPYLTARSLVLLVFRPTAEDGQYYTAVQLMEDFLLMWLRMLHVHVPSARIVLVCSRWCSPPEGEALEPHQARVSELCAGVEKKVAVELEALNQQTQTELENLVGREATVTQSIAAEEERIKQSEKLDKAAGHGDAEGGGHGHPGKSGEPQDLEHLRSLAAQLQKTRRAVTASESAAGSERDALAVTMELADGRVHRVECVGGDGSSAGELRRVLVKCARALPFMHQSIPKGFTAVKDACMVHDWDRVALPIDGREGAVQKLRAMLEGQTVDVHGALEFWNLLGFMLVHGGWLIPRPTDLIDLVRPFVHHDPLGALDQTLSRTRPRASTQDASADWVVPDFAALGKDEQAGVRTMVERLVDDNVLCEGLQKHLTGWKDIRDEERGALLENVSVVRYTFGHAPSALFPHIIASQMSNWEYKAGYRRRSELESGMLSVEIQATAERHEFFQLALTPGDNGDVQVVVVSSSVGLMRSLCAAIEGVISRRFPGLSNGVEVHFSGRDGPCVWRLSADLMLGSVLASKAWDKSVRVVLAATGNARNVSIREIFDCVPGIFISHSWKDRSIEVGPIIRDQIEDRMRELVW
ncbi:hypothetical protein T484DRAFT_1797792 [Baffinella frigidus]|nr:hypothetical protein T484DRAFT_1797792 [Cryptophyta sp. CCMP2293]